MRLDVALGCAGALSLLAFPAQANQMFRAGGAVVLPALLAPNTEAVASAEPQSRTTSSSVLAAAVGRPALADRSTRAMASAWRAEQG